MLVCSEILKNLLRRKFPLITISNFTYSRRYFEQSELDAHQLARESRNVKRNVRNASKDSAFFEFKRQEAVRLSETYDSELSVIEKVSSKPLAMDQLNALKDRLLHGPVFDADFSQLCQVPVLCLDSTENAQHFVLNCVINWFKSIEPFMWRGAELANLLSYVLVTLSRLNKVLKGELVNVLGWTNIERIASHVLDDRLSVNAWHMNNVILALYFLDLPCRMAGLPSSMSDEFLQKIADTMPHYLNHFRRQYAIGDKAKFRLGEMLYRLHYLNVPSPNGMAAAKIMHFFVEEYKHSETDKAYARKTILAYVFNTRLILHAYLKAEPGVDFWRMWCRRLLDAMRPSMEDVGYNATSFNSMLITAYLLVVLENNLAKEYEDSKNDIVRMIDHNTQYFDRNSIDEIMYALQYCRLEFDVKLLLRKFKSMRVLMFSK